MLLDGAVELAAVDDEGILAGPADALGGAAAAAAAVAVVAGSIARRSPGGASSSVASIPSRSSVTRSQSIAATRAPRMVSPTR